MKRRDFLKSTALATAAAVAAPALSACKSANAKGIDGSIAARMDYRDDGTFTLLQITDTHFILGDPRSDKCMECVKESIAEVRPDLIIHTGDILFGRPEMESIKEILTPISESGIPFAVALGNHDAEFGSTREEVFEFIRSMKGCVNLPPKEGVYGCSNDVITLGGDNPERVFYLIDSGNSVSIKTREDRFSYDYIRGSQIAWYRAHSERFTAANGGVPVPSMAFFHIPLRETAEGVAAGAELVGNNCEPSCPSDINSGLLAQFLEMGDVEAVVNGHEHDCDYVLNYGPMFYIYGRCSGGGTVYYRLGKEGALGDPIPGCRVFQFKQGEPGFHTWVRILGGEIQQPIYCHDNTITRE
jgi:hypothetical protein